MGWLDHELCGYSCATSLGALSSPGCVQWLESASKLLSSVLLSAHLSMCSINSALFFWATDPVSSPTVWPVQAYCFKLHHFNDGMAHIASQEGHLQILRWLFKYADPNDLGGFMSVSKMNTMKVSTVVCMILWVSGSGE